MLRRFNFHLYRATQQICGTRHFFSSTVEPYSDQLTFQSYLFIHVMCVLHGLNPGIRLVPCTIVPLYLVPFLLSWFATTHDILPPTNNYEKHVLFSQEGLCARARILEFYAVRPEDHLSRSRPNPKFTLKYVTLTRPKHDFFLFKPE